MILLTTLTILVQYNQRIFHISGLFSDNEDFITSGEIAKMITV